MTNDNGITISTTIETDCEMCEYREDTYCDLFYKNLEYIDTKDQFVIFRCKECRDSIVIYGIRTNHN